MMNHPTPLLVEVHQELREIDLLASEWTALETRTPEATGFQSYTWCRNWLAAQARSGRPAKAGIVTVRENGRLVMLWPLEIEHTAGVAIAHWIGEPMTQYGDLLAEPGPGRRLWFETAQLQLKRHLRVDLFSFSRFRGDGVFAQFLPDPTAAAGLMSAPYADLRRLAGPGTSRSKHKSVLRRTKQLAAAGPVALQTLGQAGERVAAVRLALAQKRSWLEAKGLFSAGLNHPATGFFLEEAAQNGDLRIHVLNVGDDKAAIEIGFIHGKAYRSLLGTFDLRFAAGSPGHALTAMLIAKYAGEGLEIFDFLAPGDPYKAIWAEKTVTVETLLKPVTLRGHAGAIALGRLRPLAKSAQMVLPRTARRALHKMALPA